MMMVNELVVQTSFALIAMTIFFFLIGIKDTNNDNCTEVCATKKIVTSILWVCLAWNVCVMCIYIHHKMFPTIAISILTTFGTFDRWFIRTLLVTLCNFPSYFQWNIYGQWFADMHFEGQHNIGGKITWIFADKYIFFLFKKFTQKKNNVWMKCHIHIVSAWIGVFFLFCFCMIFLFPTLSLQNEKKVVSYAATTTTTTKDCSRNIWRIS